VIAANPGAPHQRFPVGWYGKIPLAGDFVARRVPAVFGEAWYGWLQIALDGSRGRLGHGWREAFLSMPAWRFVFSPGLVTSAAWSGLMVPSVDAVGRCFPLAIASPLSSKRLDVVGTLLAAQPWFEEMQAIALSAISAGADLAAIDAAIAARPFREEWVRYRQGEDEALPTRPLRPRMLHVDIASRGRGMPAVAEPLCEPCGVWLADACEIFGGSLLLCEALPPAEQFCAMMDGLWQAHGWAQRNARPAA